MKTTLGTQLRHLIELLDGAVGQAYAELGLDYRPRYTPVMRAVIELGPCTVGKIADYAGISQPAATQTISLMRKAGLVTTEPGASDSRQRLIGLSDSGQRILPELRRCWQATEKASEDLQIEVGTPLSEVLASTIAALENKPFSDRIRNSRMELNKTRRGN